jgi:hypothetical protein
LTDGKGAEALSRAVCVDGGVMIADRGYAKAGEMATFRLGSSGRPRDFIVRTGWNMLRLESQDGTPFELTSALRQMEQAPGPDPLNEPREWTVQALYGCRSALPVSVRPFSVSVRGRSETGAVPRRVSGLDFCSKQATRKRIQ